MLFSCIEQWDVGRTGILKSSIDIVLVDIIDIKDKVHP